MSLQTELGIEITTSVNMPYFGSEILWGEPYEVAL